MIKIEYDNVWCQVSASDTVTQEQVSKLLYEELKYHPDGYQHVWSFQNDKWDGYNRLYNPKTRLFRRGLLNRAIGLLDTKPELHYRGATASTIEMNADFSNLRLYPFQEEMIQAGLQNTMGILVGACGSGKSVCISNIIARQGYKTMVILTDLVLLDQMQQVLQRWFNQPIGIIGDSEFDLQDITVSTIQTLTTFTKTPKAIKKAKQYKEFHSHIKDIGMVIVDEVHLADASSFAAVLPMFTNAPKFIGFSGTPYGWSEKAEKRQNIELEQHFGEVIFDSRKQDLVSLGLKAKLVVATIERDPINPEYNLFTKTVGRNIKVPDHTKNYRAALEHEILNNHAYHQFIAQISWEQAAKGRLVFVHAPHSIEYGASILRRLPGAVLVNGKTSRAKRRDIYNSMRAGNTRIIVSDIGGVGLDIPNLDVIILAGDVTDVRQIKGRVERSAPGKSYGIIIDIRIKTSFLDKHFKVRNGQYIHDNNTIISYSELP